MDLQTAIQAFWQRFFGMEQPGEAAALAQILGAPRQLVRKELWRRQAIMSSTQIEGFDYSRLLRQISAQAPELAKSFTRWIIRISPGMRTILPQLVSAGLGRTVRAVLRAENRRRSNPTYIGDLWYLPDLARAVPRHMPEDLLWQAALAGDREAELALQYTPCYAAYRQLLQQGAS